MAERPSKETFFWNLLGTQQRMFSLKSYVILIRPSNWVYKECYLQVNVPAESCDSLLTSQGRLECQGWEDSRSWEEILFFRTDTP